MNAEPPEGPHVDFASPANAGVLHFLRVSDPAHARATPRSAVDMMSLGTHPELVSYLWGLADTLPGVCACVVNDRSFPLLAAPGSGVIFGLAGGTNTLAFRLPEPELGLAFDEPRFGREYRYPSGPVRAAEIGDDWALVRPYGEANGAWCVRAFAHAGTLG
jgi:hypothetical protein